jgi:hypothetical protein
MDMMNAAILFGIVAMIAAVLLIAAGFLYVVFFYLRPYDKPKRKSLKRVRTLLRATGPAQTKIVRVREIVDPHPDTHGEVTPVIYPRTARIRDMQEPMGV